jgi:hypothetical protein
VLIGLALKFRTLFIGFGLSRPNKRSYAAKVEKHPNERGDGENRAGFEAEDQHNCPT